MSRLQFLRFQKRGLYNNTKLLLPQDLKFRASKLRFLEWDQFPLACFPREFQPRRLVKLMMEHSKLEKLWEGPIVSSFYVILPFNFFAFHFKNEVLA